MVMVRMFEVTFWTGGHCSLDRGQASLYFEIGGKIKMPPYPENASGS